MARYVDLLDSLSLEGPAPPNSGNFYVATGQAARLGGERAAARALFDSALSVAIGRSRARPHDPGARANVGFTLLHLGHREEGFRELAAAHGLAGEQRGFAILSPAADWAYAHVFLGEFEAAADSFAAAIGDPAERVITRFTLQFDPRLKPLHRLPKFRTLFQ